MKSKITALFIALSLLPLSSAVAQSGEQCRDERYSITVSQNRKTTLDVHAWDIGDNDPLDDAADRAKDAAKKEAECKDDYKELENALNEELKNLKASCKRQFDALFDDWQDLYNDPDARNTEGEITLGNQVERLKQQCLNSIAAKEASNSAALDTKQAECDRLAGDKAAACHDAQEAVAAVLNSSGAVDLAKDTFDNFADKDGTQETWKAALDAQAPRNCKFKGPLSKSELEIELPPTQSGGMIAGSCTIDNVGTYTGRYTISAPYECVRRICIPTYINFDPSPSPSPQATRAPRGPTTQNPTPALVPRQPHGGGGPSTGSTGRPTFEFGRGSQCASGLSCGTAGDCRQGMFCRSGCCEEPGGYDLSE